MTDKMPEIPIDIHYGPLVSLPLMESMTPELVMRPEFVVLSGRWINTSHIVAVQPTTRAAWVTIASGETFTGVDLAAMWASATTRPGLPEGTDDD